MTTPTNPGHQVTGAAPKRLATSGPTSSRSSLASYPARLLRIVSSNAGTLLKGTAERYPRRPRLRDPPATPVWTLRFGDHEILTERLIDDETNARTSCPCMTPG